jgi:hypothetical protein
VKWQSKIPSAAGSKGPSFMDDVDAFNKGVEKARDGLVQQGKDTLKAIGELADMKHVEAFNRGVEKGRDGLVEQAKHPIKTIAGIATTAWDGANAISEAAFGVTTEAARQRNIQRGKAVHETYVKYEAADSATRTEMLAEGVTNAVYGAATGEALGAGTAAAWRTGRAALPRAPRPELPTKLPDIEPTVPRARLNPGDIENVDLDIPQLPVKNDLPRTTAPREVKPELPVSPGIPRVAGDVPFRGPSLDIPPLIPKDKPPTWIRPTSDLPSIPAGDTSTTQIQRLLADNRPLSDAPAMPGTIPHEHPDLLAGTALDAANATTSAAALGRDALGLDREQVLANINESREARNASNFPVLTAKVDQLIAEYKIDQWTMTELKKGDIIYGGLPGQSRYYTSIKTVLNSAGDKDILGQILQIKPDEMLGYRPKIGEYR